MRFVGSILFISLFTFLFLLVISFMGCSTNKTLQDCELDNSCGLTGPTDPIELAPDEEILREVFRIQKSKKKR